VQTSREYFDDALRADRKLADVNTHRVPEVHESTLSLLPTRPQFVPDACVGPQAARQLAAQQKKAIEARKQGRFSFCFDRTHMQGVRHGRSCECYLCAFEHEFLRGREGESLLADITGQDLTLLTAFASRFRTGDFLSEHDDAQDPARRIAFVFQFTKAWRSAASTSCLSTSHAPGQYRSQMCVYNIHTIFIYETKNHPSPKKYMATFMED
jgi:hypothetical protein